MKTAYRLIIFILVFGGLVFARNGKGNPKFIDKNKQIKSEHYWIKDNSNDEGNDQLDRKRSHRRRRKTKKPIKGVR